MSKRILVVEDEKDLIATLDFNLKKSGFNVSATTSGKEGLELASRVPKPNLIILDLMLPDFSGTEICRILKSKDSTKDIPVIMLTAKGEEIDRVVGFEIGAEDYIVKPFSMRELILRVQVIIRRGEGKEIKLEDKFSLGPFKIDSDAHKVWIDKKEIPLTLLEFKLLKTFIIRKGRVQTREKLLDDVWGIQAAITTRTVDTHVKRLREKLGNAGDFIETIRGVGYRFNAENLGEMH